jgi:hypothetical protein
MEPSAAPPTELPQPWWRAPVEVVLIFMVFFVHAGWPVPDVNEPHYLCKAKAYWDRGWIEGDLFLESRVAHLVFYWAFGWLTRLMSLPAVAWTGRIITWLFLAWCWQRLSWAVVPRPLCSALTAALLVAANSRAALSQEWIVGGFEAKGISYGLVWLALEQWSRRRDAAALVLCGAATACHVLVGGWAALGLTAVAIFTPHDRPSWKSATAGGVGGLALALVGLVPALLLNRGTPSELADDANIVYVFKRLPHHLDPFSFPLNNVVAHAALLIGFIVLYVLAKPPDRLRRLEGMVWLGAAFALSGLAIALVFKPYPDVAASLLRFYWFRLTDSVLPAVTALTIATRIVGWRQTHPRLSELLLAAALVAAGAHLGLTMYSQRQNPTPRGQWPRSATQLADWIEICQVIEALPETKGKRFLTPRSSTTFKWHAQRAEVVNWKDIPQNAAAIDEWWRRMQDIHGVGRPSGGTDLFYKSPQEIRALAGKYQAAYVLAPAQPRLALPEIYRNNSFALYWVGEGSHPQDGS